MPYYRVDPDESEATPKNVAKHIEAYVKETGTHPVVALCVMVLLDLEANVWKMDYSSLDLYDDENDLDRWLSETTKFCVNEVTEEPSTGFILWTSSRPATLEPDSISVFPSGNAEIGAIVEALKEFRYGLFSSDDVIDLQDHLIARKAEVEKLPKRQQHEWLTAHSSSDSGDDEGTESAPQQIVPKRGKKAGAPIAKASEVPDTPRKVVKKTLNKAAPKKVVS